MLIADEPEEAYKLCDNPYFTLYHPHIDSSSCACYGHWAENIRDAQFQTPWDQMESIRGFLCDYNGRSTFYTVDAYAFDRKTDESGTTSAGYNFPYGPHNLIQRGAPTRMQSLRRSIEKVVGDDWIVQFCEDMQLNALIYTDVINWYIFSDTDQDNLYDYEKMLVASHESAGVDLVPFTKYPGSSRHDMEEGKWKEQYDDYCIWSEAIRPFSDSTLSTMIGQWLCKLAGYEFSLGDMHAFWNGVMNWHRINYVNSLNVREQDYMRDWVGKKQMGYGLTNMLWNFGLHEFAGNGVSERYCSNYANLLLVFSKNDRFNEIMGSLKDWEMSSRASNSMAPFETLREDLRRATQHDYERLEDEELVTDERHFTDNGVFSDGVMQYYVDDKIDGYKFIESAFNRIMSACHDLTKNGVYCSQQHINDFLNIALDEDELILSNYDWASQYKPTDISEENIWSEVFCHCLIRNALSGNNREFINNRIHDNEELTHDEKEKLIMILDGSIYEYPTDEQKELAWLGFMMFYKVFPNFPNSADEVRELRYEMDKEVIKQAYQEWFKIYDTKRKEYKDVLTNTFKGVEQGELFPKGVSI
jgi:hypothetical protein